MRLISILLILFTSIALSSVTQAQATYELSMAPQSASDDINSRISPLAAYLSEKTETNIEVIITNNYAQYEKQLNNGSIDMGFENPHIYTMVSKTHEVLVMALKGKDQDQYRGIIIARKDSDVQMLEDLRGKRVAIVGFASAGGYLSQKLSLLEVGINVDKDCAIVEAVENKQENVILSVYTRDVDAGFIRESALNQVDKYIAPTQIKMLCICTWLPNWAFSVKKTLPNKLKAQIKTALLNLTPNHPVIEALKIDAFRPAKNSEYDIVRRASKGKIAPRQYRK
jgi:phosphonate transport system substrate-binding protein